MKKTIFLGLFLVFNLLKAVALEVELTHAVFKTDKGMTYTEIYTHYIAKTLSYKPVLDTRKLGAVKVLYLFKQGDKIVNVDKFLLTSPPVAATAARENFVDQKRYALPEGEYTLEASFKDEAVPTNEFSITQTISVHFDSTKVEISDVQPIGKSTASTDEKHPYYKNGAQLEPYVLNYYPYQIEKLQFYAEIYHTDNLVKDDFVVRYFLRKNAERGDAIAVLTTNKRQKAAAVVPILYSIDISQVPSGAYDLVLEVRNRKLELLATKSWKVVRSNPYMLKTEQQLAAKTGTAELFNKLSKDSCLWSISALIPRLMGQETAVAESIYKTKDLEGMRRYLFAYWARLYPTKPQAAYRQYMAVVTELDEQYSSAMQKGHESDRGRIYLKYGKPDNIVSQESEIGAPPYEVWTYSKLNENQNYAKFIFYNESLAANDFVLLHSTARGEINDPQWQRKLYKNAQSKDRNFIDGTEPNNNDWGSNRAKSLMDE
ncbi:MAG: hypothetical protein RI894_550 [Bacteroidota bacterium]|jgi:GWxTD domain-containing protein